jgi:glc operon protein GlcG
MRRLIALALMIAPLGARAQLADTKILTLQAAKTMLAAAEAEATKNNWTMSIAVVDAAGELIAFHHMDDATFGSIAVSQGKARTAARFKRPTKTFDSTVTAGRVSVITLDGVVAVEGGVPIIVNGRLLGAVGASGGTSPQDAQVARAGIEALKP